MTITKMADIIGISRGTVTLRLKKIGKYEKGFQRYSRADLIAISYEKYCGIAIGYRTKAHTEFKIIVIECYLKDKNNFSNQIAKKLGLKTKFCDDTITEYLTTKELIIESKANLIDEKETELLRGSFK